jgi:hypothetical protein
MGYLGDHYPWHYTNFVAPVLGTTLGVKTTGRNCILLIYLPAVLFILYALYQVIRIIKCLICGCPKKTKVE